MMGDHDISSVVFKDKKQRFPLGTHTSEFFCFFLTKNL